MPLGSAASTLQLRIPDMDCPSEEAMIRRALEGMAVGSMRFDLGGRTLTLQADDSAHAAIVQAIEAAGLKTERVAQGGLLLRVPDMDCPSEEAMIRRALDGMAVGSLRFDLSARTVTVQAAESAWDGIEQAIQAAGLKTERLSQAIPAEHTQQRQQREMVKLGAALVLALGAELIHFFAPETLTWEIASMAVAALAIALSGFAVYRKGLASLLRGQLNITALMTVAVTGAFLIGQWAEAAMVMALYAMAELIEVRAVDRARNAIKSLLELAPSVAEVRQPDGSWLSQPAAAIRVGAIVRVKPGERLALDGRVQAGHSAIDQAPVTGESVPVEKGPGDEVFAGTINQHGALEFEVTAPATDTVLARIIHAVEEAQGSRAPTQRFVDRFAAVYTPAVFIIAILVAILGPWLGGWSWLTGLYKALVLLVIACPCALVISTPVTVVSGLAAAARRGILIKGGAYLEEARKITQMALDKTGTITEGKPRLVAQESLRADIPADQIWQLAAAMAARSDHPVSKAIVQGLAVSTSLPEVEAFAAEAGRGTLGSIAGQALVLGNRRWIEERGQLTPALAERLAVHERQGRSISLLADAQGVLGLFAVADAIKPSSQQAIRELRALGITPVMLTGDNPATAQAIAAEAGISEVQAGLLPQQKLEAIQAMAAQPQQAIGMVGDGINDAPALAAAQVGFAMGQAGTHTATEAADVVIMNDDLRRVPETIRLSRRAHGVLWQNISLALGIKAVFLLLAVFGNASMWMAVFADVGAALLVVFNGLRMLRWRPSV
ncbi:heavy metal translocating P-type ATPase [Brachymonas sp. J145]|uniref:heavy metal translocating P-type ATPase n=1 Tax=Brachymonas sp. J145 TaxID=3116489 RepID=UPI002E79B117|nr:heavy metal translocating P-type ATPase [Brachymonas sp. J145]MEE1652903.1 heavy metal translocating P-type ATPase [Brachymonas sp. J145]